jgi:hypothetical protein
MNDPESSLEQSEFHLFVSSVVSFKILSVNELKYTTCAMCSTRLD